MLLVLGGSRIFNSHGKLLGYWGHAFERNNGTPAPLFILSWMPNQELWPWYASSQAQSNGSTQMWTGTFKTMSQDKPFLFATVMENQPSSQMPGLAIAYRFFSVCFQCRVLSSESRFPACSPSWWMTVVLSLDSAALTAAHSFSFLKTTFVCLPPPWFNQHLQLILS